MAAGAAEVVAGAGKWSAGEAAGKGKGGGERGGGGRRSAGRGRERRRQVWRFPGLGRALERRAFGHGTHYWT
jgi:hypothetical protein